MGIGLGSSLIDAFKKSASFTTYWVFIQVKVFALELAKAKIKT